MLRRAELREAEAAEASDGLRCLVFLGTLANPATASARWGFVLLAWKQNPTWALSNSVNAVRLREEAICHYKMVNAVFRRPVGDDPPAVG